MSKIKDKRIKNSIDDIPKKYVGKHDPYMVVTVYGCQPIRQDKEVPFDIPVFSWLPKVESPSENKKIVELEKRLEDAEKRIAKLEGYICGLREAFMEE